MELHIQTLTVGNSPPSTTKPPESLPSPTKKDDNLAKNVDMRCLADSLISVVLNPQNSIKSSKISADYDYLCTSVFRRKFLKFFHKVFFWHLLMNFKFGGELCSKKVWNIWKTFLNTIFNRNRDINSKIFMIHTGYKIVFEKRIKCIQSFSMPNIKWENLHFQSKSMVFHEAFALKKLLFLLMVGFFMKLNSRMWSFIFFKFTQCRKIQGDST